jgi:hypothetical protein
MTVGEIERTMSSREMVEWKAYYDILAEERKKDELKQKAESGLEAQKFKRGRK